ncbi:MAG: ROK family transcriptional regulator [bacterium]
MRTIDLNSFQVANSETARDINRRILLNMVRMRQPISRADLARHSGLQRSTVSEIVKQLISQRWVTEGAIGHLPRGRRPQFLQINERRAGIVGIDIRPRHTVIALANLSGQFLAQEQMPTADDPLRFVDELAARLEAFVKSHADVTIEGVGVSMPGLVDRMSQRLMYAPNLGWRDVELKTRLESATGLPVEIENAANACALAEIWFGQRLDGVRDLIAVTVSEGIGTGIIANGQLINGPTGVAGEFGHVSINEMGPQCKCGNRGCWELYASNSAAIHAYSEATSGSRNGSRNGKAATTRRSSEPTFDDILRLAEQGDIKAGEVLDRMAHYLGLGISMLVSGIAPSLIVLIGEVTRAWQRVGPIIKKTVAERSAIIPMTRIVPSEDSAQPRLRGTIALVLQKHFGAPATA